MGKCSYRHRRGSARAHSNFGIYFLVLLIFLFDFHANASDKHKKKQENSQPNSDKKTEPPKTPSAAAKISERSNSPRSGLHSERHPEPNPDHHLHPGSRKRQHHFKTRSYATPFDPHVDSPKDDLEKIDLRDFVIPKRRVQAFLGEWGPGGVFHVTNYAQSAQDGGVYIYQIMQNNPDYFIKKEWTDTGYFERVDTTQWYSFSDGLALPPFPHINVGYPHIANIQGYYPNSCNPIGSPGPFSWVRTVVAHFNDDLGGDIGNQELIRVRYHHVSQLCPPHYETDEYMDYSNEYGQVRWFAICNGEVSNWRQAMWLSDDVTWPNQTYDCR